VFVAFEIQLRSELLVLRLNPATTRIFCLEQTLQLKGPFLQGKLLGLQQD